MLIQLQLPDGNPVLVNPDTVNYIQPCDDQTLIVFVGGEKLTVCDDFSAIGELFDPEMQAAEPC